MVSHTGIEPVTPWLKVMCSTDWANGSYYFVVIEITGVTDGARTRDNQYHKLALYQLNYGHHKLVERETRVELATFSLEGWRSTNWATPAIFGGGGRIRTNDLRVMSPTSYQTALPRDMYFVLKWCLGRESNPHDQRDHRILSPVRLPIPPPRHT